MFTMTTTTNSDLNVNDTPHGPTCDINDDNSRRRSRT